MTINVRQICFIMIFYTAASKLLQYPTLLSQYSGRDLLLSSAISFLVQGAAVWAAAFLASRTKRTFFEILEDSVGRVCARVVYGLFAAFFAAMTILPLFEHKLYVHAIFYDTVPSRLAFLPILFFTLYAGAKSLKNTGRCADVCMPVFLFSMAFVLFMSFSEADFGNLAPMFRSPFTQIVGGSFRTATDFLEPAYMLMFLGNFRYRRGDAAKITLGYAAGAAIVLLFLAVFYAIYGGITPSRQFAISKTALYFSAIDTVGRVDLVALYALETVQLFALVLNIQLAVSCLEKCFSFGYPEIFSVAVNAVLATIVITCEHYYSAIQTFFANWMWIAVALFTLAAPVSAWILHAVSGDRREAVR